MTEDRKERQRDHYRAPDPAEGPLTTDQGVAVDHTDDSLTVGERGPTLMEDFHFREKLTHFDHERIPERVVHARGAGAYGYFEPYESCAEFTRAAFLQDPSVRTPVFVRFSTVQGPRGSADTVRDVRGFATKFYTSEGNYDLVGNNMPVFFIQDGIKFPDFVHALKPEPQNDIPTGASAHDTLWDFVSLQPETMHMMMWLMSDRAIPRSFRMMQGFGVHTFRFVDAQGRGTFVKFHWKPKLGVHSLVWDEAQEAAGRDPDFNRRDLWEAIEAGQYPEYELGVQLIPEEDEFNFDFDLLDATKIVPEEQVPVRPIGHMVLNRNPDNFFAETEQVAFHTGNVVPGIDFTNDPLLQARNFSYLDTQLIRLGGPNFSQLPVNQPVTPARTNHRDGYHQTMLHKGTNYSPNSLGGGCPALAGADGYAFSHYAERVEGHKIRKRSESFKDFYSQAALFWNSMSDWEKRHIVDAFRFELGKVAAVHVRERTVEQLARVNYDLASQVAQGIGVAMPGPGANNHKPQASPALSLENLQGDGSIRTRQIAVLVTDGVDTAQLTQAQEALTAQGAVVEALAPHDGKVVGADGNGYAVDRALPTVASVLYDAVLLPGGPTGTPDLASDSAAMRFVRDAYRHGKPIGALGSGVGVLSTLDPEGLHIASGHGHVCADRGVVTDATTGTASEEFTRAFTEAIAAHRHWDRPRVRC
ncbi:catalase [Streptomyces melanosporofaciens]|uniref:Catalase n=1 Tax=Streptomyces melanosporofaciens TaxID=67327 RepID=A0A1H4VJL8_STRMJ|nr:catalase [Streptomyces melanosporofaciens]SEC80544.1 catalase [Streptomyces melanosporofaciens]